MDTFNYNHLFYFWTVARLGAISKASAELEVSQPTISEQLHKLESTLKVKLFERAGRGIKLSSAGQNIFSYADRMFRLGEELRGAVSGSAVKPRERIAVGVVPSVPSLVVAQLLRPVLHARIGVQLTCVEGAPDRLFAQLASGELDVVLSNSAKASNVSAFSQRLACSGVSFMSSPKLLAAKRSRKSFPQLLDQLPFILPMESAPLASALSAWFSRVRVRPATVGTVSDTSTLELFGREGFGAFAVPTLIERELKALYKLEVLGRTTAIQQEFYAATRERRPANAAAALLLKPSDRR